MLNTKPDHPNVSSSNTLRNTPLRAPTSDQPDIKDDEKLTSTDVARRKRILQRLREADQPLLATEKAHGPG